MRRRLGDGVYAPAAPAAPAAAGAAAGDAGEVGEDGEDDHAEREWFGPGLICLDGELGTVTVYVHPRTTERELGDAIGALGRSLGAADAAGVTDVALVLAGAPWCALPCYELLVQLLLLPGVAGRQDLRVTLRFGAPLTRAEVAVAGPGDVACAGARLLGQALVGLASSVHLVGAGQPHVADAMRAVWEGMGSAPASCSLTLCGETGAGDGAECVAGGLALLRGEWSVLAPCGFLAHAAILNPAVVRVTTPELTSAVLAALAARLRQPGAGPLQRLAITAQPGARLVTSVRGLVSLGERPGERPEGRRRERAAACRALAVTTEWPSPPHGDPVAADASRILIAVGDVLRRRGGEAFPGKLALWFKNVTPNSDAALRRALRDGNAAEPMTRGGAVGDLRVGTETPVRRQELFEFAEAARAAWLASARAKRLRTRLELCAFRNLRRYGTPFRRGAVSPAADDPEVYDDPDDLYSGCFAEYTDPDEEHAAES